MPDFNMGSGSWNKTPDWLKIVAPLAGGAAGFFPQSSSSTMQGSGENETNSSSSGNTNAYQNSNLTTWLSNLFNALNQTSGSQTTSYNLDPSTQALIQKLTGAYSNLATPFDTNAYASSQIQGINSNSDIARQAVANIMASRGVNGPAAATAESGVEANRLNQIVQMQQQLPFLANQYNVGNLGAASNFMSAIPKGMTTTNEQISSQQQSQNQQGNQVSNQNQGSTYYNEGWNKQRQTQQQTNQGKQGGGVGSAIGAGIGILASLFSDESLKKEVKELPTRKALRKVLALRPVSWKWTADDSPEMGVIAQDVKRVMPELVHKDPDGSGKLKVNYAGLLSEVVGAVQALAAKEA